MNLHQKGGKLDTSKNLYRAKRKLQEMGLIKFHCNKGAKVTEYQLMKTLTDESCSEVEISQAEKPHYEAENFLTQDVRQKIKDFFKKEKEVKANAEITPQPPIILNGINLTKREKNFMIVLKGLL